MTTAFSILPFTAARKLGGCFLKKAPASRFCGRRPVNRKCPGFRLTAFCEALFLGSLPVRLLAGFILCVLSGHLVAQDPTSVPVPRSYFGLTVMRSRVTTPFDFGTVRVWDIWPVPDWARSNPSAGVYDFTSLDTFLAANNNRSRDVIYTFGRTPQWASSQPNTNKGTGPGECAPPTHIEDWDHYVRAVVTHAAGRIKYWELWNEPNLPMYYCGDMPTMVLLAKHAQRIIKGIDPSALILSPSATNAGGPDWLASFLAQGGSSAIDIVAFHGYRTQKAEDILPLIAKYKAVMKANGVSGLPLWDTEANNKAPQTAEQESAFLAKYFLLQWSEGISRFVWYAYDAHPEWGQLWNPATNQASAASTAYVQVYEWMVGATLVQPCSKDASGNWSCVLTRNGNQTEALWNSDAATSVAVSPQFVQYRDLLGKTYPIQNGTVAVGNEPILLIGSTKARK